MQLRIEVYFIREMLFGITVEQIIKAVILTIVCFLAVKAFYRITCFCKFPSVRISAQRAVSPAMPESATRRLAPRAHIPYTGFSRSNCTIC